ncbi:MAG: DNA-binding protein [Campylobacteraceae bacterium]|jgi:predicted RNA-binding protein (virulence factor B family)|nr:DNA-binding protein [Campylobacteraceae bacterium]
MKVTVAIKVGKINQLKVNRRSDYGLYLLDGEGGEILLPNAYVTPQMEVGTAVDAFIYHDSENRLVASTLYPIARLGEFALLEVTDTSSFGAFVDWGLPKELFVPVKYQKTPFRVGQKRVILVALDELTNRLIGVEKFGKFLPKGTPKFAVNDKVELFILAKTPLGFKAIINNRYEGMLYANEIYGELEIGEKREGYIKNMRKDSKIDLSLQPIGVSAEFAAQTKVLDILRENSYKIPYNTKSTPEEIYKTFGISKKSFKQVVNNLQKEGLIKITDEGIEIA